jgi:hypothetical protein
MRENSEVVFSQNLKEQSTCTVVIEWIIILYTRKHGGEMGEDTIKNK